MGILLMGTGVWALIFGLWMHDWKLIVAAAGMIVIWPWLKEDIDTDSHSRRRERELDRLWDDDDLSGSA